MEQKHKSKDTSGIPQKSRYSGSRKRFWELDFLRGICVFLMVFDHFMINLDMTGNMAAINAGRWYYNLAIRQFIQAVIVSLFFILCGISCNLSNSNAKRGMKLGGVAIAVTYFTYLFGTVVGNGYEDTITIWFGVLHMLAVSILLYTAINFFAKEIPVVGGYIPAIFGVILLILYYTVVRGREGDPFWGDYLTGIFGYKSSLSSADYYPILPHVSYVLMGSAVGTAVYKSKFRYFLSGLDGKWNRPVCFLGRHALVIYILQGIFVGIVYNLI